MVWSEKRKDLFRRQFLLQYNNLMTLFLQLYVWFAEREPHNHLKRNQKRPKKFNSVEEVLNHTE
jgi:hypothetical protein